MQKLKIDQETFLRLQQWLQKEFGSRYEEVDLETELDVELEEHLPSLQRTFFPDLASRPLSELLRDQKLNRLLNSGKTSVYQVLISIPKVGMLAYYLQNLQKILPIIYRNQALQDIRTFFSKHFEQKQPKQEKHLNGHPVKSFSAPLENYERLVNECTNFRTLLAGETDPREDLKIVFSTHAILLNALDFLYLEKKNEQYDQKFELLRKALLVSTTQLSHTITKLYA